MSAVRRATTLKLEMDDLSIGFDVDKQLYYVEGGPITNRGEGLAYRNAVGEIGIPRLSDQA